MIIIFGFTYYFNYVYKYGYIEDRNGDTNLDRREAIYYSGVTFFSLGYGDFAPLGVSREISVFEVFLAQVFIIGFIVIGISTRWGNQNENL